MLCTLCPIYTAINIIYIWLTLKQGNLFLVRPNSVRFIKKAKEICLLFGQYCVKIICESLHNSSGKLLNFYVDHGIVVD